MQVENPEVMEQAGVREHLDYRERMINAVLRSGKFYQATHTCNLELLGFGGMLLFGDTSETTTARFECCTAGTYCVAHDADGELSDVTRRRRMSAIQLKRKYGEDKLSKSTKELLEHAPHTKVDVVHVVVPRQDYDKTKIDNLNMPWSSIMYEDFPNAEEEVSDVLSESGYHEMPYFYAPFSDVGASDYGMGAGHLLVGHSRQLNETERQKILAFQKMVNPPMKKPAAMTGRLNIGPGQENVVSGSDPNGLAPLYEVPVQGYQAALVEIKDIMERIAVVAKADVFVTMPLELRPAGMTATEYMGHQREKLQQAAPFVSIYEPSVLDKVITMVNNRLDRKGAYPEAPPALVEAGQIEIVYISSIAKALKQVGADSTRALLVDVVAMAEAQINAGQQPTVIHKVDFPQAADEIANGLGAPGRVIVDDETFNKKVAEEAEQKAAEAQALQQKEAAESMAKLGNVKTGEDTIAGQIMKQSTPQE
jgi:hypothetical protein